MTSSLNILLQRLTLLRISIASVWLIFLNYLTLEGFVNLAPAWLLLSLYIPLLTISGWHGVRTAVQDWQLFLHIVFECQLLTGLLFFTGGATNPFISYFLVLLVVAAYSLRSLHTWLIALLCVVDYSLLTQWFQPLLSEHLHHLSGNALFDLHLGGMWLTFIISTIIVTAFIPMLRSVSKRQQTEIQALREQQLKSEQLIGIATLAAGTAHELGTPLMTMQMLLEDIYDDQGTLSTADVDLLRTQVKQCRSTLQRLAEAGRTSQHPTHQQAIPWLERILDRWRLSHPKAQWQMKQPLYDACIKASPLLDQTLLNLLDNAAEAGSNTITLTAYLKDKFWTLDIHQPDPKAAFDLTPTAAFHSQKEHGLGLGMYLSNASVEQFNGRLHVFAAADGSSLCRLQLPIITPERP